MSLILAVALFLPSLAGASSKSLPPIPPLPAPAAGLGTLEGFRRDLPRLVAFVAQEPTAWRGRQAVVNGVLERLAHPPEGLDAAVAPVLPKLMRAVQVLARKPTDKRGFTDDVSELLYSVHKLSERGADLDAAMAELDWLFDLREYGGRRSLL